MAIYIASTKSISRAKGQSAVASASYRAGEKLYDERYGKTHNYESRKRQNDVMSADIIMPTHLKKQSISRADLWNLAEKSEKRKDARVGREWLINLPHELDEQTRKELAHTFTQALADKYGVIADCAIHRPSKKEIERGADPRNFHAHILLTTRQAELKNGQIVLDKKADCELADTDRKKKGLCKMSDEINEVRELWETLANEKLAEHNLELIDRRSYAELGIDKIAQVKMGAGATALERDGRPTEKGNINREILEYNELVFKREIEFINNTNSQAEQIIFEKRKQNDSDEQQRITSTRLSFISQLEQQSKRILARRTDSEQQIARTEQQIERAEQRLEQSQHGAGEEQERADSYYRKFEQFIEQHRAGESRIAESERIIDTTKSIIERTQHAAGAGKSLAGISHTTSIRNTRRARNSERLIDESNLYINRTDNEFRRQAERQRQRELEQQRELERQEQAELERQRAEAQRELERQAELERQRQAEQERLEREQAEEQARLAEQQAQEQRRERERLANEPSVANLVNAGIYADVKQLDKDGNIKEIHPAQRNFVSLEKAYELYLQDPDNVEFNLYQSPQISNKFQSFFAAEFLNAIHNTQKNYISVDGTDIGINGFIAEYNKPYSTSKVYQNAIKFCTEDNDYKRYIERTNEQYKEISNLDSNVSRYKFGEIVGYDRNFILNVNDSRQSFSEMKQKLKSNMLNKQILNDTQTLNFVDFIKQYPDFLNNLKSDDVNSKIEELENQKLQKLHESRKTFSNPLDTRVYEPSTQENQKSRNDSFDVGF